jgi:hypothetical protein
MNQNIWGSHMWFSLHTISFNYPLKPSEKDKKQYENYFTSLQFVIPCPVCKKNYIRHIQEHPIQNFLNTRKSLVYWVIDMHNMVNAEIGKKIVSYDTVIKKYESAYNKTLILDEDHKDPEYTDVEYTKKIEYKSDSDSNSNSNSEMEEKKHILEYLNAKNIVILLFSIFLIVLILHFLGMFRRTKK